MRHIKPLILLDNIGVPIEYKLYIGKSQTRNAIKLLEVIGFDNDIIESAEKLAKKYELTGIWS